MQTKRLIVQKPRGTVARLTSFQGGIVGDTGKPNGQPRRCLDASRAERNFGWSPKTGFEGGLRQTITWSRAHRLALDASRGHAVSANSRTLSNGRRS